MYCAGFMFDETRQNVQATLQGWWDAIRQLELAGQSRRVAFLRVVAGRTRSLTGALFGDDVLSVEAVAGSVVISQSMAFAGTMVLARLGDPVTGQLYARDWLLFVAVVGVGIGLAYCVGRLGRQRRHASIAIVAAFLVWLVIGAWTAEHYGIREQHEALVDIGLSGLSVACDLLYIAVYRSFLERAESAISARRVLPLMLAPLVLGLCLGVGPSVWGFKMWNSVFHSSTYGAGRLQMAFDIEWLGFSNGFIGLISIFSVAIALVLLVHAICWHLFSHLLYPIVKDRLVFRRRATAAIGFALFCYGFPILADLAQQVRNFAFPK